jgi:hypothetical protein
MSRPASEETSMTTGQTRRERCAAGRHTPVHPGIAQDGAIRHDICRYCGCPIMRTQATRIWFRAGLLA